MTWRPRAALALVALTCICAHAPVRAVDSLEQHRLFETLSFDASDLAANQSGRTTLHQRPWLRALFMLTACSVAVLAIWFGSVQIARAGSGSSRRVGSGLFTSAVLFAGSALIIWISYPGILDVASGNACRLEGELRGYRWLGKGRQSVKLNFEDGSISGLDDPSALEIGRAYRVFYNCHSKTLASIEPI